VSGMLCKSLLQIYSSHGMVNRLAADRRSLACYSRQLGGADGLADVALSMFGDVGEETDYRGGQALPAYFARGGQVGGI
jgi:hypothetical protein